MGVQVRPASLFDVLLLRRLQAQGVSLDPKRALTRPESPLWVALRAPLALYQPTAYTYLAWVEEGERAESGFVQARSRGTGQPEADITYVSPAWQDDAAICQLWAQLLEAACWEMALAGVQRVFASLPADAGESTPFLNAGFVIFAREEILCARSAAPAGDAPAGLRPQRAGDAWALQRLYATTAPLGVRQAEGLVKTDSAVEETPDWVERQRAEAFVLEQRGEIVGHIEVTRGRVGHWLRLTLQHDHPEAAEGLVDGALTLLGASDGAPVYCNIRTYENVLKPALLARRFEVMGRRDLAVRQNLARVRELAPAGVRALEPQPGVTATVLRSAHGAGRAEGAGRCPNDRSVSG